ncbi:MAG TPA: selenocysteine-specific translation elongation factor [Syntrophomonas sp.]|jgi:selenocysteine-specific elongation factor|nr:selenocysteine-specific translation elongation factor [Syntrophomonas sp.]
MKRVIIGTAGHIDHGKTTLVRALTGIDTDRLKEEKQRGISIELGFAPFALPGGQKAAIVDVPGHERFIKHMLAGAFGIDMVIFTIAADEGVMPQTREHMDIIELLGVNKGIIVLTKKDMVDEEWLLMMEEEIREYAQTTILKDAPIVAVSAVTGDGIPELLEQIEQLAEGVTEKPVFGQARLPIDRVFTVAGFGTVVTGTLWSGQIKVGDVLELMPVQRQVKVRTLQNHNEKVDTVLAGQRVAVNLQGIEVADIKRGYLLATPGYMKPSHRVDARLRLLSSSPRTLKNWNRVRFHIGTDETMGRILLLDRDELLPGDEALVQIAMEKEVVCYKNDRFVIRYYSPVSTIGGGFIIDPAASRQKRFNEKVLNEMAMKEEGSLYDVVLHELETNPLQIINVKVLAQKTSSTEELIKPEVEQLLDDEKIIDISGHGGYLSHYGIDLINEQIQNTLVKYHESYPMRPGYPREDIRSRLFKALNAKEFNQIIKYLSEQKKIAVNNNYLLLPGHTPQPGKQEQAVIDELLENMYKQPFNPPSLDEMKASAGVSEAVFNEIISYLAEQGLLVRISENMYFTRNALEEGKQILSDYFDREKELSLAMARDLFNTSRKYALPLVEYYDRVRFTRRVGDLRIKA